MLKRILSIGLATSAGIALLAGQALAVSGHFGYIQGYFDTTANDERSVTFEFEDCSGDVHDFHFRQTSDLDAWVTKVNDYMDTDQFLNIGTDDTGMVTVMATMGGDCEILGAALHATESEEETDDEDMLDEILEVYEDATDLPEGHVLSEPPAGFEEHLEMDSDRAAEIREKHKEKMHRAIRHDFKKKHREELNDEEREEVGHNLRRMIKHHLLQELHDEDRELTPEEIEKLKKISKKRAHMRKFDEDTEHLEREVGFTHVNPVRLERKAIHEGKAVTLRGLYKAKEDENGIKYHVLVNPEGEMFVKLDVQGEDYSEFEGKKVFVKGIGYRAEKRLVVDKMRELNRNESENNNSEMQFRIGASLYKDLDSNSTQLWYAKYLGDLFDKGVFTGYEDGSFGGANPVTLAEIAKVAAESAEHDVDVRADHDRLKHKKHWAKFYLKHAEDFNLLPDVENPDLPAKRVEVIEAILRAYGVDPSEDADLPDAFPDTKNEFIRKAFKLGIVNGFPDGFFRPDAETNRAEVAKMMTLAAELLGEMEPADEIVDEIFDEIDDLDSDTLEQWVEDIDDNDV